MSSDREQDRQAMSDSTARTTRPAPAGNAGAGSAGAETDSGRSTGGQDSAGLPRAGAALRNALVDSRERWRELVAMTADLAFETDEQGRFSFITPDPALGWAAEALLGQPADRLLADGR